MLLPLLGIAVSLIHTASPVRFVNDTSIALSKVVTPTILHTPVIGVKSIMVADSIVVEKGKHTLTLYAAGMPVRTYQIALGKQPKGDKIRMGDNRTPEGLFRIDYKNPDSKYHMSLHISYPDEAHIERARRMGYKAGGDIMIHGLPKQFESFGAAQAEYDWTEGCIAVTNQEIEEIWRAVPQGSPIEIKP
jgi:murein L,D-transpeptidase YafK